MINPFAHATFFEDLATEWAKTSIRHLKKYDKARKLVIQFGIFLDNQANIRKDKVHESN